MVDFLVMGNGSAVICKNVFPLIKERRVFLGVTLFCGKMPSFFYRDGSSFQVNSIAWFTSFDVRSNKFLDFKRIYREGDYKRFDERPDIINIDRTEDIPDGYYGLMGVPVTFLNKWNPEQFDVIGIAHSGIGKYDSFIPYVDNEWKYPRILIRKK